MLFCELDGRVLGGMQLGVLVEVPLCEIDGRVLGGNAVWVVGGGAVLRERWPGARGHAIWGASEVLLCELDGRGMQFGALVTAGCWGACSLGPGQVVWGAGGSAALRDWRPGARGHGFCFARASSLGCLWRCRFARLTVGR